MNTIFRLICMQHSEKLGLKKNSIQFACAISEDSNQSAHSQYDQSLCFLTEETLDLWLPMIERPSKTDQTAQVLRLIGVFNGCTWEQAFS